MIILAAVLFLALAAFIVAVVLKISSQVNERLNQMNQSLQELWKAGKISSETAIAASASPEDLQALMKGIRIGQDTMILGS